MTTFNSYSEKLLDHALNPRNVGEISCADGIGLVGDQSCGDFLKVWINVENDKITDIKFKCKGCPAAIGTASAMTEMALGKNLDDASYITDETITEYVGGLPEAKQHCSNLGANALYEAIMDYTHKSLMAYEFVSKGYNIFKN